MNILGIDIGGSGIKGAPVDIRAGKLLAERFRLETPIPATPPVVAKVVCDVVRQFKWKGPIGIGYPGVIHGRKTMTAANMHPDWIGLDAQQLFEKATGRKVSLINDADAAGLAEVTFGAGRGFRGTILMLTLGTGVGSALFYKGHLYPSAELGHLPLRGKDAEKRVAASVRAKKDLSWHDWGHRLNEYIGVLEKILWPELIIIGGGVSSKHAKYFKYIETRARLVPAMLLNDAGTIGAALGYEDSESV